jgi:hypothetical protein
MTHLEAMKLLEDAGIDTGWALADGVLVLWEHDTEPPAPLTRPEEVTAHEESLAIDTGSPSPQ